MNLSIGLLSAVLLATRENSCDLKWGGARCGDIVGVVWDIVGAYFVGNLWSLLQLRRDQGSRVACGTPSGVPGARVGSQCVPRGLPTSVDVCGYSDYYVSGDCLICNNHEIVSGCVVYGNVMGVRNGVLKPSQT